MDREAIRSIWRHAFLAAILFLFDAILLGGWILSFLVTLGSAIATVAKIVSVLIKRQALPKASIVKFGIYFACTGSAFGFFKFNSHLARNRAEAVISAVKQYRAKHSRFPETLEALVPEFLPSVPRPKLTYMSRDFHYRTRGDSPTLMYVEFLLARWTFDFEREKWIYVD